MAKAMRGGNKKSVSRSSKSARSSGSKSLKRVLSKGGSKRGIAKRSIRKGADRRKKTAARRERYDGEGMVSAGYCKIHGVRYPAGATCPLC